MGRYRDLSNLKAGRHVNGDGEEFWIEHHKQDGKRITVALGPLQKGALAVGFPLISTAYHVRSDGSALVRAGYDAWADKKWLGRFPTEVAAHAAIAKATGGKHPPKMMAVVPDPEDHVVG